MKTHLEKKSGIAHADQDSIPSNLNHPEQRASKVDCLNDDHVRQGFSFGRIDQGEDYLPKQTLEKFSHFLMRLKYCFLSSLSHLKSEFLLFLADSSKTNIDHLQDYQQDVHQALFRTTFKGYSDPDRLATKTLAVGLGRTNQSKQQRDQSNTVGSPPRELTATKGHHSPPAHSQHLFDYSSETFKPRKTTHVPSHKPAIEEGCWTGYPNTSLTSNLASAKHIRERSSANDWKDKTPLKVLHSRPAPVANSRKTDTLAGEGSKNLTKLLIHSQHLCAGLDSAPSRSIALKPELVRSLHSSNSIPLRPQSLNFSKPLSKSPSAPGSSALGMSMDYSSGLQNNKPGKLRDDTARTHSKEGLSSLQKYLYSRSISPGEVHRGKSDRSLEQRPPSKHQDKNLSYEKSQKKLAPQLTQVCTPGVYTREELQVGIKTSGLWASKSGSWQRPMLRRTKVDESVLGGYL